MARSFKRYMIEKMDFFKNTSISQKKYILLLLITLIFPIMKLVLEVSGRDFPSKNSLNYSEGILFQKEKNIALIPLNKKNKEISFTCDYKAYVSNSYRGCIAYEDIKPYFGRNAKISWYYQSSFLGFNNKFPQLVSLQVEEKNIISYEDTLVTIKKLNMSSYVLTILLVFIWSCLFMVFFYPRDILYKED